ncbi:hypothetical protein [Aliivibrio fischeri]|uniref:hypothetical protein n=1 Tax=Aliivibrio fischeri TaxID=668 RepID=UPI00080DCA8E|nr:hypothetical protein [Aliivibrio fischeri]OCH48162.1 hypothetical protein A6E02_08525 [Aliivibrio fischeri]
MLTFKEFLNKIIIKKIKRKDLMVKLQLGHEEFNGVDAITMSRWFNGVTTPSLYRQLLICELTNCKKQYFELIEHPKIPVTLENSMSNFTTQFDSIYHELLRDTKQNEIYTINTTNINSREITHPFMKHINAKRKLINYMDDHNIKYSTTFFITGQKKDKLVNSYIFTHTRSDLVFKALNIPASSYNPKDSLYFGLGFYRCSSDHEVLFGLVLNHLVHKHLDVQNLFIVCRGLKSMLWLECFGAEQVSIIEASNKMGNIYLYTISTQKILSNPVIITHIKKYWNTYLTLTNNCQ